ncbi:hypothetical protein [Vibrio mexicanus]|uniref:hypothetical protein n=1 Tax=Vibrio mexicanus TaxID=1004326 RepID=UPI00063CB6BF|nr:hypothetical protein [Vibrio mexicanus]
MESSINAVEKLSRFKYHYPKYHSDGKGHVQVEQLHPHQADKLAELVEAVDQQDAWEACRVMLQGQSHRWLTDAIQHIRMRKPCHIHFQLLILDLFKDEPSPVTLITQSADGWPWDETNWQSLSLLIEAVIKKLDALEPDIAKRKILLDKYHSSRDFEADSFRMLTDLDFATSNLKRLIEKYEQLKSEYEP